MNKFRSFLSSGVVLTMFLTSCGQSGDDTAACKSYADSATTAYPAVIDFMNNWEEREGYAEGAVAAIEGGGGMQQISDAASAAAKVASGKGKKLFENAAKSFEAAAVAIPRRGGTVESYEAGLIAQMGDDWQKVQDFCSGFGS